MGFALVPYAESRCVANAGASELQLAHLPAHFDGGSYPWEHDLHREAARAEAMRALVWLHKLRPWPSPWTLRRDGQPSEYRMWQILAVPVAFTLSLLLS